MSIRILDTSNARVVRPNSASDPHLHAVANLLVGNSEWERAIEVSRGSLEVEFGRELAIALVGKCEAKLDGIPLPLWRAVPVPAGSRLKIRANSIAYLAIAGGLEAPLALDSLRPGLELGSQLNGSLSRIMEELPARYVPESIVTKLISRPGEYDGDLVGELAKCLRAAIEAYRRGARLVRVRVGGLTFDAWVEELD